MFRGVPGGRYEEVAANFFSFLVKSLLPLQNTHNGNVLHQLFLAQGNTTDSHSLLQACLVPDIIKVDRGEAISLLRDINYQRRER